MRAVAVYLVVLFHAGTSVFSGGYIGVDVFFVLSGFLVTQLLLRDVNAHGSIRFGRFYSRRFRRLLPAAFVALTVTAIVFTAIASPAEVVGAAGSFKAAFLYSTNWYFIHNATGYFGADISQNPVLHFWSLAVEEQFYLLWPLALGGAFAVTRRISGPRQMRAIRIAVVVAMVASAAAALALRTSNPNRAYYGTDTRAYELLAGALLALVPSAFATAARYKRAMVAATVASAAGIVVLGTSWLDFDAIERGIAVTVATCVLIVALEATGGIVKRLFSTRSMVFLGKISYGTYLWHWLVILVILKQFHVSTGATAAYAILVATALAALSYQIMEHPVRISRRLDRHRRVVIATGLAVSVASALVLIPQIVTPANASAPSVQSSSTAGFTPVPASLDWQHAKDGRGPFVNCFHKPVAQCIIVHGTGRQIMLIGDSHAQMLIPTFRAIARREHLTLSATMRISCPWQRDLVAPRLTVNDVVATRWAACEAQKEDLYTRVIPQLKPDIIVVMNLDYWNPQTRPEIRAMTMRVADKRLVKFGSPAFDQWLATTTSRSLDELRANGRKVVVIEPIPIAPISPLSCISSAKVLQECRYVANPFPDQIARLYRQIAKKDDRVWVANFDRLVCPYLPICDPVVGGHIVKVDNSHLSPKFAASIAPEVDDYLKQIGVLPN